jgi:hypothetical protein
MTDDSRQFKRFNCFAISHFGKPFMSIKSSGIFLPPLFIFQIEISYGSFELFATGSIIQWRLLDVKGGGQMYIA